MSEFVLFLMSKISGVQVLGVCAFGLIIKLLYPS
jgi:hypothetical protein